MIQPDHSIVLAHVVKKKRFPVKTLGGTVLALSSSSGETAKYQHQGKKKNAGNPAVAECEHNSLSEESSWYFPYSPPLRSV